MESADALLSSGLLQLLVMVLFEGLVDGVGDSSFDDAKCFEAAVALFFTSLK